MCMNLMALSICLGWGNITGRVATLSHILWHPAGTHSRHTHTHVHARGLKIILMCCSAPMEPSVGELSPPPSQPIMFQQNAFGSG